MPKQNPSLILSNYFSKYIQLDAEESKILFSRIQFRNYLKNQYIEQAGDVCQYQNFVLNGCLKTFYIDMEGNEHIVSFAIEGWWAGDLGSFISQRPADYNVQCIEKTEVAQISYNDIELLYEKIPKMERFFRILIQNAYVAAQRRIMENFSLTAKQKYLHFQKRYPSVNQRVPQYMIASYLGFTPEFLSKIRSQIIREQ